MTLLQRIDAKRAARREQLRHETRLRLRQALGELLPRSKVMIFRSLLEGRPFHENSDVDVALFAEPKNLSIFGLIGELEERVGRPVDVILLEHCRFKDKILREGELWTNSD